MYFNGQVAQRYSTHPTLYGTEFLQKGENIFLCAKRLQIVVILNVHTKIRIYFKK